MAIAKRSVLQLEQSANRLAGLLYLKAEYGQVIKVALPAIQLLKEKDYTTNNDYFNPLGVVNFRPYVHGAKLRPFPSPCKKKGEISTQKSTGQFS